MRVLVTGGAGFIGSHVLVELLGQGAKVVVLDNLVNGSSESLKRVERITGHPVGFVLRDIRDSLLVERLLIDEKVDAVIHLAGLKAVGESVDDPLEYYESNVQGTISLLRAMQRVGVFKIVFSSSATIYQMPGTLPISESSKVGGVASPYGRTKLTAEHMLDDLARSDARWSIAVLRYFNPIGAHESGLIGEDPCGTPNNLLPYIAQVAVGRLSRLTVHGGDYPTIDGTGVRDYIHVCDLAAGHTRALEYLRQGHGYHVWNLGTGTGYSVLQIIEAFERVSGRRIPFTVSGRRPGDVAECWADVSKAERELGWKAGLGLECMIADAWRWQVSNPSGYS
ncbi:UDP-glucose 4-epimerase GalE [Pseudomonas aeruginosa]|uniref:UDP-glucose 4-epimerase GalE n=1 Tax=Pseudomonas aeruginosa TaxID=287 RepID=UPI0009A514B8|nr:UDP-glucose 4-epimerase GalE [Pseudomonas aeruginosa]